MMRGDAIALVDKERGKDDGGRRVGPEPIAEEIVCEEEIHDTMKEDVDSDEKTGAVRKVEEFTEREAKLMNTRGRYKCT